MYSYIKIHKIGLEYEFMTSKGKIREGVVREVDVRLSASTSSIIYVVELDGEFLNVEHETNRQI